jgi:hypothetical protein
MLGFAAFVLWMILILAIGGSLFLIVDLLRFTYKERSTLASQGYGARIRPPQPARRPSMQIPSIGDGRHHGQMVAAGPYGRGRRRGSGGLEGDTS